MIMELLQLLVTLLLFARPLFAYVDPVPHSYCCAACEEALAHFNFAGDAALEVSAYTPWTNPLRIKSVYYCMKIFCPSETDISAGIEYLQGNCVTFCPDFRQDYIEAVNAVPAVLLNATVVNFDEIALAPTLNRTAVPSDAYYSQAYWTIARFYNNIYTSHRYGYAMYGFWGGVVLVGMVLRFFSWLGSKRQPIDGSASEHGGILANKTRKLSLSQQATRFLTQYFIVPPTWPKRCRQPVCWFTLPNRLGSITIFAFVTINVVLAAQQYRLFLGNLYYPSRKLQFIRYFADRTGVLAFSNLPLVWLFAARNNLFLWLTGWSFGTFNSFHRWTARVATLEAIVHSLSYTAFDLIQGGYANLALDWKTQYFYNGGIAVISMCLILACSTYSLRLWIYEVFLFLHIGFAIIVLACCFYHVGIFEGRYNNFLWPCVGIWIADRLIRFFRLVVLNLRAKWLGQQATASYDDSSHIIRLDVPVWLASRPTPGTYYFLYTPTRWKGWESHPFTLAQWNYLGDGGRESVEVLSSDKDVDVEKGSMGIESHSVQRADSGTDISSPAANSISRPRTLYNLSFMIRPYEGYTLRLKDKIIEGCGKGSNSINMGMLVEGPYGHTAYLDKYEQILFIMGGSGITVAISYLRSLLESVVGERKLHLVWSVRELDLASGVLHHELGSLLAKSSQPSSISIDLYITGRHGVTGDIVTDSKAVHIEPNSDTVKFHYRRPEIANIIEMEAQSSDTPMAIMMSGPAQMADDTRSSIVDCLRSVKRPIEYYEEVFGW